MKEIIRNHSTAFLLVLIVILALILRLHRLDFQSLWVDEIASMLEADPDLTWSGVVTGSVADQPPAFFLLLHGWFKMVGYTDYTGRLFSVVAGLAGVIVMFFLGREVKDPATGLVASLITAVSYMHILFSQEARFYTLLFLFTGLSYLFFIRAVKREKSYDFLFYSIFTALLVYTQYFGLVVLASQGIIFLCLVFIFRAGKRFIFFSIGSALLVVLLISPWIPIFYGDSQITSFWIQPETFYFPIVYFYVYFKDVVACSVFALLIVFYFFTLFKKLPAKEKIDQADFVLVGWGILSYLIPTLYSIIRMPMLQVRYTIIALPALILMISLGFFLITSRLRRVLLITTSCTILLSLVLIEKHYTKIQKEDWRGMVTSVIKNAGPEDVLVSRYASYCNYYVKQLQAESGVLLPGEFYRSLENPPRVCWMDGFDISPEMREEEFELLKRGYVLEKTDSFVRTRARYYKLGF